MIENSGYVGKKYSVRAKNAYGEGKTPLSQIKRIDIEDLDLKYTVSLGLFKHLCNLWGAGEWHHTSSFYNETNFYDLEEVAANINNLSEEEFLKYQENFKKELENQRREKLEEKENYEWVNVNWTKFTIKGGYTKSKNYNWQGIRIGDWVYIYGLGKKNINGRYVDYKKIDESQITLKKHVKESLLLELNLISVNEPKRKRLFDKVRGYEFDLDYLEFEKEYKEKLKESIKKDRLKEKKIKDKIKKKEKEEMKEFSKIKINNILKKIKKIEEETGLLIIKNKDKDSFTSLYDVKKYQKEIVTIVGFMKRYEMIDYIKNRQSKALELGFSYYIEELPTVKFGINIGELDRPACKELYNNRKRACGENR